jgi:hypothetical protein
MRKQGFQGGRLFDQCNNDRNSPSSPVSAVSVYLWRRKTIRRKEDGNYDDPYGPMALAATLMCIYFSVFGMGVSKLANNATFMAWLSLPTEI